MMYRFSCPVRCGVDGSNANWVPCGAASSVAFAATIFGTPVAVAGDDVYARGEKLPSLDPSGEKRTIACPGCPGKQFVTITRIADNDPDYRTPGPKGDCAEMAPRLRRAVFDKL